MELNEEFSMMHELDREFLRELKIMSDKELIIQLKYQSCEDWRRIAIEREMDRRLEIEENPA